MSKRVNNKKGNHVAKRQRRATKVRGGGRYQAAVDRGAMKMERLIASLAPVRLPARRPSRGPYKPHQGAQECARRVRQRGGTSGYLPFIETDSFDDSGIDTSLDLSLATAVAVAALMRRRRRS
jgi:hypothetical protein